MFLPQTAPRVTGVQHVVSSVVSAPVDDVIATPGGVHRPCVNQDGEDRPVTRVSSHHTLLQ